MNEKANYRATFWQQSHQKLDRAKKIVFLWSNAQMANLLSSSSISPRWARFKNKLKSEATHLQKARKVDYRTTFWQQSHQKLDRPKICFWDRARKWPTRGAFRQSEQERNQKVKQNTYKKIRKWMRRQLFDRNRIQKLTGPKISNMFLRSSTQTSNSRIISPRWARKILETEAIHLQKNEKVNWSTYVWQQYHLAWRTIWFFSRGPFTQNHAFLEVDFLTESLSKSRPQFHFLICLQVFCLICFIFSQHFHDVDKPNRSTPSSSARPTRRPWTRCARRRSAT